MACEHGSLPEILDVREKISELYGNVEKLRNVQDFVISRATRLSSPVVMTHCRDEKTDQEVSICLNLLDAKILDNVLKDLQNEIKLVLKLEDSNILKFYGNTVSLQKNIGFIYEDCSVLLSEVLAAHLEFVYRPPVVKYIMKEIFKAIVYLHRNDVVHRDIQTENISIACSGVVKVWNFWLAQTVGEPLVKKETSNLRYQPVEAILKEGVADPSLDIWSASTIFGELLLKKPVFRNGEDNEVLEDIFGLLSFPTQESWNDFYQFNGIDCLKYYGVIYDVDMLQETFGYLLFETMTENAWHLLKGCLVLNPKMRLTADVCVSHPYFGEDPRACEPAVLEALLPLAHATCPKSRITKLENLSKVMFL